MQDNVAEKEKTASYNYRRPKKKQRHTPSLTEAPSYS